MKSISDFICLCLSFQNGDMIKTCYTFTFRRFVVMRCYWICARLLINRWHQRATCINQSPPTVLLKESVLAVDSQEGLGHSWAAGDQCLWLLYLWNALKKTSLILWVCQTIWFMQVNFFFYLPLPLISLPFKNILCKGSICNLELARP